MSNEQDIKYLDYNTRSDILHNSVLRQIAIMGINMIFRDIQKGDKIVLMENGERIECEFKCLKYKPYGYGDSLFETTAGEIKNYAHIIQVRNICINQESLETKCI